MSSLNKMSYDISCEHIKKINDKYNAENEKLFKEKFNCIVDNNYYDDNNKKNIRYLNNIYISKKSCIYKSTEPDELTWASNFNTITPIKSNNNELWKSGHIDILAKFNENTRRKILTRY